MIEFSCGDARLSAATATVVRLFVLGVVLSPAYVSLNLECETTDPLVLQRGPAEYDLFLRPDLHTHGHTQWFYFAVRDTHPSGKCLFEASPPNTNDAFDQEWDVDGVSNNVGHIIIYEHGNLLSIHSIR